MRKNMKNKKDEHIICDMLGIIVWVLIYMCNLSMHVALSLVSETQTIW